MTDSNDQRKSDLRSEMRTMLAEMDDAFRHDASASACSHLTGLEVFRHASVVMLYMPLANEVDLTPAAIHCFRTGKTVCVPRVDWKRRDMDPVEITSFDDEIMDIDEHGIRTPREGSPLLPTLIDLVVIPGLAFDPNGHRLGRGGGYYDQFLKRLRRSATTVGLGFDAQITDEVPADDRDISVDVLVTDRRVTHIAGTRARR
jgi:5-formyltetrahydrofolate cyclo-ligase